jgi:hypothetical protein
MEGYSFGPPFEGERFTVWNEHPLDSKNADVRFLQTSVVQRVTSLNSEGTSIDFDTLNSSYHLDITGEV